MTYNALSGKKGVHGMRNYGGYGKKDERDLVSNDNEGQKKKRHIKTVVEGNTIYDVDLDCLECLKKKQNKK